MRQLKPLYRFIVTERPVYATYVWDAEKHGPGKKDDDIIEWLPGRKLDPLVEERMNRAGSLLPRLRMRRRWQKGFVRLFTLMVDGKPACFGMTQDWSIIRRELASFDRQGDMLGPYWTLPEYQRRGLYSRMLLHNVHLLAEAGKTYTYVWVQVYNVASRKAIERCGFHPMGCWEFRRSFCRLHVRTRLMESLPATVI